MSSSAITDPHDRFFRVVLAQRHHALAFLDAVLPAPVRARLALETLTISPDSFVDTALRKHFSDLVYRVELAGRPAFVYVLFEHKSYAAPHAMLQLLRYMVAIWIRHLDSTAPASGPLPVIVPVLLTHGTSPWAAGTRLGDLFGELPAELSAYVPDFHCELFDLVATPDDDIVGPATLRVALLLMKHAFDDTFVSALAGILRWLRGEIDSDAGRQYLQVVLEYIARVARNASEEELTEMISRGLSPREAENMATVAEKWLEKGRQEGLERGLEQGLERGLERGLKEGRRASAREAVLAVLTTRFTVVPAGLARQVQGLDDLQVLDALLRRAIVAQSLAVFREELDQLLAQ